tara:strand:- start:30 stop:935 length:906 start_codon:yes stop_codon:yes gene_type:complete
MEREKKLITKDLKESTAKSYLGSYMRLRKILNLTDKRKPIKNISAAFVLDAIKTVENPSTAYSVFVIAKKLIPYSNNKEIFDILEKDLRARRRVLQVNKNQNLTKSLPNYKEISEAVKRETEPRKYITSFIMLKINTRNQDIALADLWSSPQPEYDKKRNHLILDGDKVLFIRNVYKTAKKYGQKKNIIAVKKFAESVKKILGDNDKISLFTRKNGEHITPASIASYLKKYVVLGLNESQIVKSVIAAADEKGSYDALRKISANRGTRVDVLLAEYDVSNITEPADFVEEDDGGNPLNDAS